MAFEREKIAQSIGGLICLIVYSAHAVQDNSEAAEGVFGSVPRRKLQKVKKDFNI